MPTAVETQNLTKIYQPASGWRRQHKEAPVTAVHDVSLTIPTAELFGLLGPNGAGKTTLVKMLCTLIEPSSGTAVINGHSLTQAGAIRAAIGLVVSDERSFYWRLSAQRNLDFFAAMYGLSGETAQERVTAVLQDVDLLEVRERRFSSFSSGMRQRLAIARALLHQPKILFLDEPSRSLDPTATQQLHDLILRLRQAHEMTIFLITHDLNEAEKLCDRVALMHKGHIQTIGNPHDLRRQLNPKQQYTIATPPLATAVQQTLQQQFPNVQIDATALHFQSGEEDGLLTAVLTFLHDQQISIQTIDSTPPSLEEVFHHYTQGSAL